jgi:TRAP transporter TAXI family solute receptor
VNFAGFAEMPSLLKDGHVDMALLSGNSPHPVALDVETHFPLRILPMERAKMEAVMREIPGLFITTIPAGRYKGNKKPVDVLAVAGIYIVNKDLPNDFMYEITKAYMQGGPGAVKLMPHLNLWSWEKGKTGIQKDLMHPGCLRAFEEAGYGYK